MDEPGTTPRPQRSTTTALGERDDNEPGRDIAEGQTQRDRLARQAAGRGSESPELRPAAEMGDGAGTKTKSCCRPETVSRPKIMPVDAHRKLTTSAR